MVAPISESSWYPTATIQSDLDGGRCHDDVMLEMSIVAGIVHHWKMALQ
jgi:hypothetical protein